MSKTQPLLQLLVQPGRYAIVQWRKPPAELKDYLAERWLTGQFVTVSCTDDECSLVCPESDLEQLPPPQHVQVPWRLIRVAGQLDFELTGILHAILEPLAQAGISIFAISTYDTDYLLVRQPDAQAAIDCLADRFEVITEDAK